MRMQNYLCEMSNVRSSPTIGLSFRSLVNFCIVLLVVTKLERLVPGSEAADDL